MKSCLPIIASLFLASTPFTILTIASENQIISQAINPHIKDNIAREISVKITSEENGGSGVIIAQQDNTYLILTNAHVLRDDDTFNIQTHDGITHQAKTVANGIETNDDLALLQFSSDNSYQTATINSAATPRVDQSILAVGYDAATGKLVVEEGKIERVPDKTFKDGYSIGYSNNIVQGMSGGAILNIDGEVIGINGKTAFPIVDSYVYQDGTKPTSEEIPQLRKLSWGLTIERLLTQINPGLITAYGLPQPELAADIGSTQLTGWLSDLEQKAKQITVKIDNTNDLSNGSGIIIAKQGDTYTVLTADHVICQRDDATQPCRDFVYEIVTNDGQKYPLEVETIRREEGVDLAVVKFYSSQDYQVAQLADYPLTNNDAVFVAGYPKLSNSMPAQWRFSPGYGLDREQGLIQVNDNSLTIDSGLTSSQGSLSGGYEMTYTSITYGGMSGGAVLDKEGKVIGIHGLAEGETAIDTQNSSSTQIQLGYSLGIPISTFVGLADRFEVESTLAIKEKPPSELSSTEQQSFIEATLNTEIPQGNATAENWLERGNQLWRLERYEEAVQAFDRAIAQKPKFVHLAHYGKGMALLSDGQYEAAVANLELAITTNSKFMPAYLYQSAAWRGMNQFDKALIAINQAISLESNNANLYNEKWMILLPLKRYQDAEIASTRSIKLNPRSSFYSNRGFLYKEQGKFDLALADYNQAIKIDFNHAAAYNNRGNLYQEQGKLDLALDDYNQAIEIDSDYTDAYFNRGFLYQEQGKLDLALANYNRAIKIDSDYTFAYSNRGLLYKQQSKLDLALADYNQAIEIDSDYTNAYFNRGNLYREQGKFDLALADYNQAIKIDSDSADVYLNRGLLYKQQGKLDLALADYNQAIEIDFNYTNAYNNRGLLYQEQGKLDLALADYTQAIEIDFNYTNAYNNRGLLYKQQGKFDLALADYTQIIEIDSDSAAAYNNRGVLYQEQGEFDLALADYTQAIKIDSDYADAYNNRSVLYQEQGKFDLALADYTQIIEIDSNNAFVYFDRGNLYKQQGKLDLALTDYTQAIEIDFNYTFAYSNRGLLYQKQGEFDLALADFTQAIKIDSDYAFAYFNRASLYRQQGNFDAARNDLIKAQQLFTAQGNSIAAKGVESMLKQLP